MKTRVSGGQPRSERECGPAGADHARAGRVDPRQDLLVGVEAEHAPTTEDERVDGVALRFVARRNDRLLVRDRHVRAGETFPQQLGDGRNGILDVARLVLPVEPERLEGRVLHPRRQRVRDGVTEERDALH